jgi:hypothetical protein
MKRSATVHKLVSFTQHTACEKKGSNKMERENLPPSLKPSRAKTLKIRFENKLNRCAMVELIECSFPTVPESYLMTLAFEHKQKFNFPVKPYP